MMCKGKRRCATVYLAAVVILMCYLAQMIACDGLKKTGRQEADTAKAIGFQEGEIVFGSVFEKGLDLASKLQDGTKKPSSNASMEEEAAYQLDFTGWSKKQMQDTSSKEALWKRMEASLQCGGDHLKFRALGPGASQFAVEQGHAPPLPLSQIPSACGYSMQRNSLALVMLVPYDGCNMVHEGGHHVLPMHWHGVPVSLWCPKTAPHTGLHHTSKKPGDSDPDGPPSHFFPPYRHPLYPFGGLPEQTTTTTRKPQMPKFPRYPHFPSPRPPTATAPSQMFHHPADPPYFPHFPWHYPGPQPVTATILPWFPPYGPFLPPFFPSYPQYSTSKPQPHTKTKRMHLPLTPSPWDHQRFHPHPPFMPYPSKV